MNLYIKSFVLWIIIAGCETVHGIIRARWLARQVGDLRSRQIAVFTGSGLIFLLVFLFFDWLQIATASEAIQTGSILLSLMILFEFLVGHFVFGFSWKWIINDFNLLKGKLLLIGMIFLLCCPWLVGKVKGIF